MAKIDPKLARELVALEQEMVRRDQESHLTSYEPRSFHYDFITSPEKIKLFVGSNQCIGAETEIYDPILGASRRVDEIDGDFHVLAWDGKKLVPATACKPFTKPAEDIYRVTLDTGEWFTCSMDHLVLTPSGFRAMRDLPPKSVVCHPQSSLGRDQLVHASNDLRWTETAQGSQGGYPTCPRSCDAPLPVGSGTVSDELPLQDDAQACISYAYVGADGSQSILDGSHLCQLSDPLSNQDVQAQIEGHGDGIGSYVSCRASISEDPESPVGPLSIFGFSPFQPIPESDQWANHAYSNEPLQSSMVSSESAPIVPEARIKSIEFLRNDVIWDLTVPVYHNYLAGGAIQHNSGKTTAVCHEIAAKAIGYRPWVKGFHKKVIRNPKKYSWVTTPKDILNHEKTGKPPPAMIMVVGLDYKSAVAKVIWPKLREIIPPRYIKTIQYMQGKIPEVLYFENGSEVHFMSCEQDTFRFEGGTWDLAVFDEPPPQDKWIAVKRGLMVKQGTALFSMTPLAEPWIFDDMLVEAQEEGTGVLVSSCDLYSKEIDWITNKDKQDFEKSIHKMNPHEVEARVHGKFTHLMGRVIQNYNQAVHHIDPDVRPIPKAGTGAGGGQLPVTFGMTIDPHDRRPWAIGWWWVDSEGEVVFFKESPETPYQEIKSSDLSISDYCKLIKDMERDMGIRVTYRYLDPNSGPRINGVTKRRTIDELALEGIYCDVEINDSLQEGHECLREYLAYDTDKGIPPKMFVHNTCWNINHSILRYTWREKKPDQALSEKPDERFKDFVDVVRYTVIKRPVHVDSGLLAPHGPSPKNW